MPTDSTDDRQLQADLRLIGRLPRWIAVTQMVLLEAVIVPAYLANDNWWYIVPAAIPVAVVALALRIRARVEGDGLVVRSFLRNYTFQFARVEMFARMPYQGIWSGGGPAGWLGLNQIDVEGVHYSWSKSLPATMCSRATAERIESALNRRVEGLWKQDPSLGASET